MWRGESIWMDCQHIKGWKWNVLLKYRSGWCNLDIFQHITVKHLKQNKVHPVRKIELCYKVCYCFFLKYVHIYFETKLLTKSSYFQYVISNYVYYKDKKNWSNDRWHIKRWTIWSMIGIKHTLTPIYFIPRCFSYFHQMLS